MKDAPELYELGAGRDWLAAAGRTFAFAATLGLGALAGYVPQLVEKPETIQGWHGQEQIARTVTVGNKDYKISKRADALLSHGFHRMKLCGATFTPDQLEEIIHGSDTTRDLAICGFEAGNAYDTILNPLHESGQAMLPLERRMDVDHYDGERSWFALYESMRQKDYIDVISR